MLFYVHRNRRLIRDGGAQDGRLDFHTAPKLGKLLQLAALTGYLVTWVFYLVLNHGECVIGPGVSVQSTGC